MSTIEKILIVGGGIAGLTAARALGRRGFQPELIEQGREWRAEGGGIAVQPNGLRILRGLDLEAAAVRAGERLRRWRFCDAAGGLLCESDLETLWGDVGPFIGIERTRLQRVLVEGAAGVPCRLGVTVSALTAYPDRVEVAFSDGTSGNYDLVIGTDGISSSVRRLVFGEIEPTYTGAMAWRSTAPVRPHGLNELQFLLGEGCFFGLCPVGDGRTYGFGNIIGPRMHEPVTGRLDRLRRHFGGFAERVREYLAALDSDPQIHCGPVDWVALDSWHSGRVVLIGDAAHASSPMMGQGGCMAMEDASALADSLAAYAVPEQALTAFVARRRPRVDWVHRQSMAVAEGFRAPGAVRDDLMRQRGREMFRQRFAPLVEAP